MRVEPDRIYVRDRDRWTSAGVTAGIDLAPALVEDDHGAETGGTPGAFVESLRIEAARGLLETTDLTVGAIARTVGYRHGETLHRIFARRPATTPERHRRHFSPAGAAVRADRGCSTGGSTLYA